LIKKGIYVTTAEAKNEYQDLNRIANIDYIYLRFNTIADTAISIAEEDIILYYDTHEKKYQQEESRTIEYVAFDIIPSKEDTLDVFDWVNDLKEEFQNTREDSLFINLSSDRPFDNTFHLEGTLSPVIDSLMHAADTGYMYGPYLEDGIYKIAKLVKKGMVPDSVHARHILVKPTVERGGLKGTREFLDSLKTEIEGGADFAQLVADHSEDPGSRDGGGDLGWFAEGAMVKPFNDAVFYYDKVGDMPIIQSQFGLHLIEILEKEGENPAVQLAILERRVEASSATENDIFQRASKFLSQNRTTEAFDKAVADQGLTKRIAENIKESDRTIIGLTDPRELIRWAYKEDEEAISKKVVELQDKFIVALLKTVTEEGTAPLEDVRVQIEIEVKKDKKAQVLVEKFENVLAQASTLADIANELETEVQSADNITFSSGYVSGLGRELNLVGVVFASQTGNISKPVKGDNGVSVITVREFKEISEPSDYARAKAVMLGRVMQSVDYEVFDALKEIGNIVDNRYNFY
ncbi:peptidyl-prolyl cis-trans isomerase, partial [Candidatus Amoebophilus asiaticus]|nr:peptidyl-prolyl cis-trans isomerase [Candidatus Amoebophilus asiaticus]